MFTQYCTLTFDTNYENADHCTIKESSIQKNALLSSIYSALKKFFQSTVMSWGEVRIVWAERMNAKGDVAEVLKHRAPIVLFPVWERAGLPTSECDGTHKVLSSKDAHLCVIHPISHLLFSGGFEAPREAEGRGSWFRTLFDYMYCLLS